MRYCGFEALVALRKAEFRRYRQSDPPTCRFETSGAVYHAQDLIPPRLSII